MLGGATPTGGVPAVSLDAGAGRLFAAVPAVTLDAGAGRLFAAGVAAAAAADEPAADE
jgi:hypothetical protein